MAYEVRPNTGSLFKNDKKESDTHPDYKGSGLIEGVGEVWLDAWINTSNSGTKYMSLKFKPKDADQRGSYAKQEPQQSPADLDDDVPF
jgi:uncharacterized protein (DUF736 family)